VAIPSEKGLVGKVLLTLLRYAQVRQGCKWFAKLPFWGPHVAIVAGSIEARAG
jgi:hypothetical protein